MSNNVITSVQTVDQMDARIRELEREVKLLNATINLMAKVYANEADVVIAHYRKRAEQEVK